MEQASVRGFNDVKGCAAILRDRGGEIVGHPAAVPVAGVRTLREGQGVQFAALHRLKGLQAESVQGL